MARPLKPATRGDVRDVEEAVKALIYARGLLKRAGADRTVARVRLAITSAGGALRHVKSRAGRTGRA